MKSTAGIRPAGVFLRAEWRHLLMMSWVVDPGLLRRAIPQGTEMDDYAGQCWVSLVGFRFLGTRVLGIPIPGHQDFDEINLRFCVRRRGPDGWERGVAFLRELVPRRVIAWVARTCYHEPYLAVPMASTISDHGVDYRWRLGGRWNRLTLEVAGTPFLPDPTSRDGWLAEHYWGFTPQPDGGTLAYRVEHRPWQLRLGHAPVIDADLATTYGATWAETLAGPPASAFIAEGSPITVSHGRRLAR